LKLGLTYKGLGFREFAFHFDFKVAFSGAFGEDRDACFAADFDAEFKVYFFDFEASHAFECADDVPGVGADGALDVFELGLGVVDQSVGFVVVILRAAGGGDGAWGNFGFDQDMVAGAVLVLGFEGVDVGHGVPLVLCVRYVT
jgi:hypothetical protein